jgi:hypothetical protein
MSSGSLSLKFIFYTAFRLSPFIIVSFFSLSSILNNDLKGIVYLAGLLLVCAGAVVLGNTINLESFETDKLNEQICNTLTLSDMGRVSKIPLSLVAITYTFFYLVDIIVHYKLVKENIPTFMLFSSLIMAELYWNRIYGCAGLKTLMMAIFVGIFGGVCWARIIRSTGSIKLQYFSGISNNQVCSRPSKQQFKCTTNKT